MAGESPDKSKQQKPSGETARTHEDPRSGYFREPEPVDVASPRAGEDGFSDGPASEVTDPADRGGDSLAGPADALAGDVRDGSGEDAPEDAPGDGEAGEASANDRGDERLRAAVAAWMASGAEGSDSAPHAGNDSDSGDVSAAQSRAEDGGSAADGPAEEPAGTADAADGATADAGTEDAVAVSAPEDTEEDGAAGSAVGRSVDQPTSLLRSVLPPVAEDARAKDGAERQAVDGPGGAEPDAAADSSEALENPEDPQKLQDHQDPEDGRADGMAAGGDDDDDEADRLAEDPAAPHADGDGEGRADGAAGVRVEEPDRAADADGDDDSQDLAVDIGGESDARDLVAIAFGDRDAGDRAADAGGDGDDQAEAEDAADGREESSAGEQSLDQPTTAFGVPRAGDAAAGGTGDRRDGKSLGDESTRVFKAVSPTGKSPAAPAKGSGHASTGGEDRAEAPGKDRADAGKSMPGAAGKTTGAPENGIRTTDAKSPGTSGVDAKSAGSSRADAQTPGGGKPEPADDAKNSAAKALVTESPAESPADSPSKAPVESPAERTSRFVPLPPESGGVSGRTVTSGSRTGTTMAPPMPPHRPASDPLPESERTKKQPLPPQPSDGPPAPLDLLAQLTNTPPPPETPLRVAVRRVKIWTPLVALLLILFSILQAVRPLPDPELALTARATYTFKGDKPALPWPAAGQAYVEIPGLGGLGASGEEKPVPIASVAKVMTAYVILRDHPIKLGSKGESLTVDAKAVSDYRTGKAGQESVVEVTEGQKLTEYEALQALMLPSANNVARLLARWDAKSEDAFVDKMNDVARELGMKNTRYTDPSGLTRSTVSTARDQVKLGKKVMRDPVFREIVRQPFYTDSKGNKQDNYNRLIPYTGIGIKTGTSTAAGGNLLFAAEKPIGGTTQLIIGAVLGQHRAPIIDSVTAASRLLISAAQDSLVSHTVVRKGQVVGQVDDGLGGTTPVVATKDVKAVGWPGLKVVLGLTGDGNTVPHEARAGTRVGVLTVGSGPGQVRVPVEITKDLVEPSFGSRLTRIL